MKILVVDDSRFMRRYIKTMLREAGYINLIEAENGQKAIEMYKLYNPSLVIMDFNMPELDGLGALIKIKRINPDAKVIMCTSMGGQKWFADELSSFGANQVIEKPYFQNLILNVDRLKEELSEEVVKPKLFVYQVQEQF